jgi:hypothetical protein
VPKAKPPSWEYLAAQLVIIPRTAAYVDLEAPLAAAIRCKTFRVDAWIRIGSISSKLMASALMASLLRS